MEEEELEQIPWSALVAEHRDERNRTIFMAAGVAVALLLGFMGARLLTGGVDATTVTLPVDAAAEGSTASVPAGDAEDVPGRTIDEPSALPSPDPQPLSEADLMALVPDEMARAAIMRAEWFVTDLFTADLDPMGSGPVRAALPSGLALPVLPHDTGLGVSYVEWARAFRVEPLRSDVYLVGVVFRTLAAPGDGLFSRTQERAVAVTVQVTPDGGSLVLDLPTPIAPPAPPVVTVAPIGPEAAPDHVLGAAVANAAAWGYEPQVVSSGAASGMWRVVVSVTDEVGNRWPTVFWFDETGTPAPPPPA